MQGSRVVRAPRGTTLSAKSWLTEAPLRMLMNNLDPEVAERPEDLVVYGGIGKAARNWECYDAIVAALRRLEADQTLLVQSGKPVGIFRPHAHAPPAAATISGASMLAIECDPERIAMRLKTGYLDAQANTVEQALGMLKSATGPTSIGLLGNAAELLPQLLKVAQTSQLRPSLVTDQTSAHDPANGYLPEHWSLARWKDLRKREPDEVALSARESIARHVRTI